MIKVKNRTLTRCAVFLLVTNPLNDFHANCPGTTFLKQPSKKKGANKSGSYLNQANQVHKFVGINRRAIRITFTWKSLITTKYWGLIKMPVKRKSKKLA